VTLWKTEQAVAWYLIAVDYLSTMNNVLSRFFQVIFFSALALAGHTQQAPGPRMIPGKKGLFFKKHTIEFRAMYGKWTAPDVVDAIGESVLQGANLGDALGSFDVTGGGVYGGSIIIFPDNKISIGADFLVNTNSSSVNGTSSPGSPLNGTRSYDMRYSSVLGRVDYHYINFHHFKLYSSTAVGVTWGKATSGTEQDKKTGFAYQITPIGVAVGGMVCAWAEAGFGYRGVLCVGIAVRL
jgi:hypothetical protein